jgi:hypothetical protein
LPKTQHHGIFGETYMVDWRAETSQWKISAELRLCKIAPKPRSSKNCNLIIRSPSMTAARLAASSGICAAAIPLARWRRHSVLSPIILVLPTARTPGPSKKPLPGSWIPSHSRGHYHYTASRHIFSDLVRWSREARHVAGARLSHDAARSRHPQPDLACLHQRHFRIRLQKP